MFMAQRPPWRAWSSSAAANEGGHWPSVFGSIRVPSKSVLINFIRRETYTGSEDRQFFCENPGFSAYGGSMKSAYELAMSRLEKQAPTRPLTEEQKTQIAEVDSEITAKIAEKKVFLEGEIKKAAGDTLGQDELRRQLASEISRLEEKREQKKQKIREGA